MPQNYIMMAGAQKFTGGQTLAALAQALTGVGVCVYP